MQLRDFLIDYTILCSRVWDRNGERYIENQAIINTRKSKKQYKKYITCSAVNVPVYIGIIIYTQNTDLIKINYNIIILGETSTYV